MTKLAFLARFEAKPGKEEEVAKFLEFARDMAKREPTTIHWYALRLSHSTFGVFDTFNDEDGRQRHLSGPNRSGFDPRADVNGDGIVNILDLSAVARQLPAGKTCR